MRLINSFLKSMNYFKSVFTYVLTGELLFVTNNKGKTGHILIELSNLKRTQSFGSPKGCSACTHFIVPSVMLFEEYIDISHLPVSSL